MSRATVPRTLAVAALLLMASGGHGPVFAATREADAKPIRLVLASSANRSIAMGKALLYFTDEVTKRTGGRVTITSHLDGSLYSEASAIQAAMSRAIDLATISDGNYGAFGDEMFFMNLPYVFRDRAGFAKFVLESELADEVKQRVEKSTGLKPVAFLENVGLRVLVQSKHEARIPRDITGVRFRTVDSPVEVELVKAWGGAPTPIAWAETYNALSQGVVDGLHTLYNWSYAARHFEVAKYVTEVQAVIGVHLLLMNKGTFDAMPADVRKAILEAGRSAERWTIELDTTEDRQFREKVQRDFGVKIYTPKPEELQQWREAAVKIWPKFSRQVPADFLERLRAAQQ